MLTNEELKKYVTSAKNDWDSRFGSIYQEWLNFANAIITKTGNTAAWRSNIFIPLIPMYMDEQLPKDLETLVGSGNYFSIKAKDKKDEVNAKCYQELLNYYLERNHSYNVYTSVVQESHRFPLGWMKQYWNYDMTEKEYYDVESGKVIQIKNKVTVDEPKICHVPFNKVYPCPNANGRDKMFYIVEEFTMTKEDLIKMKDKKWADKNAINAWLTTNEALDNYSTIIAYAFHSKTEVAWLLEDYTVIRHTVNPLKSNTIPYYFVAKIPIPGELYGKGLVQILRDLNNWVNLIENMKNDNLMLSINKVLQKKRNVEVDYGNLEMDPGSLIEYYNEDEKMSVLELGGVNPQSFTELNRIVAIMDRMVGAASGVTSIESITQAQNDTATGAIILAEENARRSAIFSKHNKVSFLKPHLEDLLEMLQQYVSPKEADKILSEELKGKWQKEPLDTDILTKYDILITGEDTSYSKNLELKKLELGLTLLSKLGVELDKSVVSDRIVALTGLPKNIVQKTVPTNDTNLPPSNQSQAKLDISPEELATAAQVLGEEPDDIVAFVKYNGVQALAQRIKDKISQPNQV